MNNKIISFLVMLMVAGTVMAQEKSTKLQKLGRLVTGYLDKMAVNGLDTNYVTVPRLGGMLAVSSNFARISSNMKSRGTTYFGDVNMNVHSNLNGQVTFCGGYRGVLLSYSHDFIHGYNSDFSFSLGSSGFRMEFRRNSTDGIYGKMVSSGTGQTLRLGKNDVNIKSSILNAHYIFNSKKFSYAAPTSQTTIQKRSAGSLVAMGFFVSSTIRSNDEELRKRLQGMKDVEFEQAAVGLGYGYNHSIRGGKVLLHAMAVPMVVVHNRSISTVDYTIELPDGSNFTTEISRKIEAKHGLSLTGIVRGGVTWNINDHFYFAAQGLFNHMAYDTEADMRIRLSDWTANTKFGLRF